MWDLPGPGIKPGPPALAGGFLTTVPPEKSLKIGFIDMKIHEISHTIHKKSISAGLDTLNVKSKTLINLEENTGNYLFKIRVGGFLIQDVKDTEI